MSLSEWIAKQREKDRFWFGERFPKRIGDDGEITYASEPVPLRPEDLLFPSEGDRVWAWEPHNEDRDYLWHALQVIHESWTDALILTNELIDFGVPGLQPLTPDLAVLSNLDKKYSGCSCRFDVAAYSARPELAFEVTYPTTRDADLGPKVDLYRRAGFPAYVIVDHGPDSDWENIQLIGYEASSDGYRRIQPDERGRIWIEPMQCWLLAEGRRVCLHDEFGNRILDRHERLHVYLRREAKMATKVG